MKLSPHKSRALFEEASVPLVKGGVVSNPDEARSLAEKLAAPFLVRPCLPNDEVRAAASTSEAEAAARALLTLEGDRVLIEEQPLSRHRVFAFVSLDRWEEKPFLLVAPEPVSNIYSSRYLQTEGIPYVHFALPEGLHAFQARALAKAAGFGGSQINSAGSILSALHHIWIRCDAEVVAAQLVQTFDGRVIVSQPTLEVDEDALFRHTELKAQEEMSHLYSERERTAMREGNPWVDLDGDIGMFVAGSGMGMAANDVVALSGGRPANFTDVGGGPTVERVAGAFSLLFTNPKLRGVLAFYFGGISRCDIFAQGMIKAIETHRPSLPIVVKMAGTKEQEGKEILDRAMKDHPTLYTCIRFVGGTETSVNDLAKRLMDIVG